MKNDEHDQGEIVDVYSDADCDTWVSRMYDERVLNIENMPPETLWWPIPIEVPR
jgi:hypothetical protein